MMGGMFAGTEEAPGEVILYQGRSYKSYRGMGSHRRHAGRAAPTATSRKTTVGNPNADKLVPEGIEGRVPYKGSVVAIITRWPAACAPPWATAAAPASRDAQKAEFVEITSAGIRESHVHDVQITKEAPNYRGMIPLSGPPRERFAGAPRAHAERPAAQAAMRFIMLVVLIDMISIGLIMPVLPALVGSFTSSQADQAFWYGAVTLAFALASFCRRADARRAVRPLRPPAGAAAGLCGLALNFFATALATSLWMLVAARLVGGAMQANAAVANAYVADITPPEERARRFGLLGAMFGIGFILGPGAGRRARRHRPAAAVLRGRCAGAAEPGLRLFVLPESLPPTKRAAVPVEARQPGELAEGAGRNSRASGRWWGAGLPGWRSSPAHQLGALHHLQVRLGADARTAGPCSRWA
jgi:hypothetical protein